jgi:hypothetical protein
MPVPGEPVRQLRRVPLRAAHQTVLGNDHGNPPARFRHMKLQIVTPRKKIV